MEMPFPLEILRPPPTLTQTHPALTTVRTIGLPSPQYRGSQGRMAGCRTANPSQPQVFSRSNAFPSLPAGSETHGSSPRPSPCPLRSHLRYLKHSREANSLSDFHMTGRCREGSSSGIGMPGTVTLVPTAGAGLKRPPFGWRGDLGETGAWRSAPRPASVRTPNQQKNSQLLPSLSPWSQPSSQVLR